MIKIDGGNRGGAERWELLKSTSLVKTKTGLYMHTIVL